MTQRSYKWHTGDKDHDFRLAWVPGTGDTPYPFGGEAKCHPTHISGFHISSTPVTQSLWARVMGSNPAERPDPLSPVENVSWTQVTEAGGFLDRLNSSDIRLELAGEDRELQFRLPSETEWEYAARGEPHWQDGLVFSGSNDPDAVAWYGPRWTLARELASSLVGRRLGWRIFGRRGFARGAHKNSSGGYQGSQSTGDLRHVRQRLGMVPGRMHRRQLSTKVPPQLGSPLHCLLALRKPNVNKVKPDPSWRWVCASRPAETRKEAIVRNSGTGRA